MVTVRRNTTGNGYKKEERRGDDTFDHHALWGHYAPKPHRRINTARPNASHTSEGLTAYKPGDRLAQGKPRPHPRPPTATPGYTRLSHSQNTRSNLQPESTARIHDHTTGIYGITQPESTTRHNRNPRHNTTRIHG